ncbi:hypothetical protein ACHAW5_008897 [Stephanodiscus triporus]|uniref:Uncharacterized protein n=1 Tax=Stephanodiscus triporus TaxID=2934178 RepID=A0ABD3N532_9STRA
MSAGANEFDKHSSNLSSSSSFSSSSSTTTLAAATTTSIENEIAYLRAEISSLSYLIKQSSSQQDETQALARRAEARAYIIEHKLMDIQSHVVKIPALEKLAHNLREYLKERSPSYVRDAISRATEYSRSGGAYSLLTSKYAAWLLLGGGVVFWQYRMIMYQRTSEEVANVAAMTLQQDSLRRTIQETLTTVANSPETLASLSVLFQKLISEERTEMHLINLIVRALNSEGVRDAALRLLDVCFKNEDLQGTAGEFLKVAANATVLDEGVQRNAGVGIQRAMKSAVLPQFWWAKNSGESSGKSVSGRNKRISTDNGGDEGSVPGDGDVDVARPELGTNSRVGNSANGETEDTNDEYGNESTLAKILESTPMDS